MDLVVGAKRVIISMEHTAKGSHKILKRMYVSADGGRRGGPIITDMAVIDVTPDGLFGCCWKSPEIYGWRRVGVKQQARG